MSKLRDLLSDKDKGMAILGMIDSNGWKLLYEYIKEKLDSLYSDLKSCEISKVEATRASIITLEGLLNYADELIIKSREVIKEDLDNQQYPP